MYWLLQQDALAQLKAANEILANGGKAEDLGAFLFLLPDTKDIELLSIEGDVGTIDIKGVLRSGSSYWGTGYTQILDAIDAAEANDAIKTVDFNIDSPGGAVSGLFEVTDRIAAMTKKTRAVVGDLAASAAYAIAAQADEIIATSRAATFGSIGIVQTFYVWDDEVSVTSTNAPDKRPDPKTAEGVAAIRQHLDALHDLFVDAITTGRTNAGHAISDNDVNADFGRGGVFLAAEAVERGMIDKLDESFANSKTVDNKNESATLEQKPTAKTGNISTKEGNTMTLQELQAAHPELYRQIVAAGVDQGIQAERDRASAHLIYGAKGDCLDTAIEAVKSGEKITEAKRAEYLTAIQSKSTVAAIIADDDETPETNTDTSAEVDENQHLDAVFAMVDESLGIESK